MESLSINGSVSFEKRDKIVKKFVSPDSAQVLIFLSVGAAGLNLSVADVVIMFVSTKLYPSPCCVLLNFQKNQVWSYQDSVQIIGRAHRQPQKKVVKAIHLLACDSSDVLLNSIALRKREMFDAFVSEERGKGKVLRKKSLL